jgi:cytochrome c
MKKTFAPATRAFPAVIALSLFLFMILLSCNQKPADVIAKSDTKKPDDNRFTPVVLTADGAFDEPMNFEVLKDGRVFINERKGALKVYDPITKMVALVGTIPVNTKYTSAAGVVTEAEEGFMGFTVDPNFEKNHWAYLYYAHPTEKKHLLTRWEIKDNKLVAGSEKVLLEIGTQREVCCHTGGGMTWDANGNLYLTVGNNTANVADKSQTDERPGRSSWDDQRGSGNTNNLRGKILRIHPEDNGTYSIPEGNLFPKGTAKTRPEIYVMGDRNPWRPSIDSKTGWLYWGEVGPDASANSKTTRTGMDELNQARKPGNFGWPYFIGENHGYPYYNYTNDSVLGENNPSKPLNHSVNNTGLTELPPAQPAFISYPYGVSEKFPEVGSGARCAVGGPIYHAADFTNAKRPFPDYYEGKWIATDLSRGWIMSITMNDKGDYQSMERFLPAYQPIEPIDMKFGPEGDLYVLEYGSNWFRKSENAKLVRIEYNAGNRIPIVNATANASGGATPFHLNLSSAGTKDNDGDSLKYEWKVVSPQGAAPREFTERNPSLTLSQAGTYTATLTVTDPHGASNSKSLTIVAGNEPPVIALNIPGNKSFFFPGKAIDYTVTVNDKEDGNINPAQVAMSIDYVSEGFDYAEANQQQRSVDAYTRFAVARQFINNNDCNNCHHEDTKSIGPMFTEIADKYKSKQAWALDSLPKKIRSGGSGVWGAVNMPAHPAITLNDARTIVNYILHFREKNIRTLPLKGNYTQKDSQGDNGKGTLIIRAAYTDKGATGANPLTTEKVILLRSPHLNPASADVLNNADIKKQMMFVVSQNVIPKNNGYIGFKKIDLTGIKQLELSATANPSQGFTGGTIEIREDSPAGALLGETVVTPVNPFAALMNAANATQNAGGSKPVSAPAKAGPPAAPATAAPKKPAFNMASLFSVPGIKVNIKDISGVHDFYLVFKNDKAKPAEPLVSLSDIKLNDVQTENKTK